ncbi:MAG: hypothetical protein AB1638_12515 [Nitrospirota bacterium]
MPKRVLLIALILIALSGLMLHFRIHNFIVADKVNPGVYIFDSTRFLSFIFPAVDVIIVTLLFTSRKTAVYGYLLNGFLVIYGTVFMTHFSIAELTAKSVPMKEWLLKSTLADTGIAWADFFIGKALYDLHMREK